MHSALSLKPGVTVIIWDLQYSCEGYMALALAQHEDLFWPISGYLYWHQNGLKNRIECSLCPHEYRLHVIVPSGRGLYIYLPSESNGPNLLDEPLKGFIVNPTDLPWKWGQEISYHG